MLDLVLLALLVAAGFIGYRLWWSRQSVAASASAVQPLDGIESVGPGGVIQLPPHGPDMSEADMQVTARHVYEQDGFRWYELEGDTGAGTVWLDIERDDELETSVTLKRLRIDELGFDESTVGQLRPGATVRYNSQVFTMTEQGKAKFLPGGDVSRTETLEFWDFEGDDDRHDLTVERWGQEYRAYLSQRIPPSRIRIYRATNQG